MIDITVKYNGKKTIYKNVPTSWHDMSTEHFFQWLSACAVDESEPEMDKQIDYLSVLTRIPVDVLKHCPVYQLKIIADDVEFAFDFNGLNNYKTISKSFAEHASIDIGLKTYEQIEDAKESYQKAIADKKHPLSCSVDLLKIYTGMDVSGESITSTYGILCFFFNSWIPFMKNSNV